MTPKTIITVVLAGVALVVGAQAASAGPTPDAMREDGFDRAVAAAKLQQWMAEDGFDRAVQAKLALQSTPHMSPDTLDTMNRVGETASTSTVSSYRDAFERAVPPTGRAPVSVTTSGRDVEWPQIGIGFGVGILLAFGLYLAVRLTRARALAH